MTNLFLAYAIVWGVLMGYVVSIAARQNSLRREIATLKALLEQKDQGR
ncbi:MAG: CcmD family protein [Acidobacteria bacterium]|nr:CcmD family protein [Acidobacteriota bacterium]